MLRAQSNNELLVCLLLACLVEHAHVCLATIESLGRFTETAGQSIVNKSELQDTLERLEDGHLSLACGGICADFDLTGGLDGGLGLFSVRLGEGG